MYNILRYFITCQLTMSLYIPETLKSQQKTLPPHQSSVEEIVWRINHLLSKVTKQEEWKKLFQEVLDEIQRLWETNTYEYNAESPNIWNVSEKDIIEILPDILHEYPTLGKKLTSFISILGTWNHTITQRLLLEYAEDLIYESKAITHKTDHLPTQLFFIQPNDTKERIQKITTDSKIGLTFTQEWSHYEPEHIIQIIENIQKVKYAEISIDFSTIPPTDLEYLFSNIPALKAFEIYLNDLKNCSEAQLKSIFWNMQNIRALTIRGNQYPESFDRFSIEHLSAIFSPLKNLKSLTFSNVRFWNLSHSQLQTLRWTWRQLRLLAFTTCDLRMLSDECMDSLFDSLQWIDHACFCMCDAPNAPPENYKRRILWAKLKHSLTIDSTFLGNVPPDDRWKIWEGLSKHKKIIVTDLDKDQEKLLKKPFHRKVSYWWKQKKG